MLLVSQNILRDQLLKPQTLLLPLDLADVTASYFTNYPARAQLEHHPFYSPFLLFNRMKLSFLAKLTHLSTHWSPSAYPCSRTLLHQASISLEPSFLFCLFFLPPPHHIGYRGIPTVGLWGWPNTWNLTLYRFIWQQFISHMYSQTRGGHHFWCMVTWGLHSEKSEQPEAA